LLTVTPFSGWNGGAPPYSDGQPVSLHTYDACCELDGFLYTGGAFTLNSIPQGLFWKRFNPALHTNIRTGWQDLASIPAGLNNPDLIVADPNSKKLFCMGQWALSDVFSFYRTPECATNPNSWSTPGHSNQQWGDGNSSQTASCAYRPTPGDPTTGTIYFTSDALVNGRHSLVFNINWTTETISGMSSRTYTNVTASRGWGFFHDVGRDTLWAFGGGGSLTTVYGINPTTGVETAYPLSGDAVGAIDQSVLYGRWVWLRTWNCVGILPYRNGPAYIFRLPVT
jgi:hypothetical protein